MPAANLPSALGELERIGASLKDRPAIFLDYDGTLTPVVPDPSDARIGDVERSVLATLSRKAPVAIVSGRNLDELRQLVAVEGLIYSGNHGWEIEGPGIDSFQQPLADTTQRELDRAYEILKQRTRGLGGVVVERKRFAIAVHTRRVSSDSARAAAVDLASKTAAHLDGVVLSMGKEVAELLPAVAWNKGRAVGLVLDSLSPERVPIYIGDDQTDEDGFAEAARRQGVGVVVGRPAETAAGFSLAGSGEVLAFLGDLGRRIADEKP